MLCFVALPFWIFNDVLHVRHRECGEIFELLLLSWERQLVVKGSNIIEEVLRRELQDNGNNLS